MRPEPARGPWGITGRIPLPPGEVGAWFGGVPGDSGGFNGARIRSCPFRILVAADGVKDLTRTSHTQNDVAIFLCFDFPIQFVLRQISTVARAFSLGCLEFKNLRRSEGNSKHRVCFSFLALVFDLP